MGSTTDRASVAHLVRRVAFGAPAPTIDALTELGYEGAVDALCTLDAPDGAADALAPPTFDTAGYLASRRASSEIRQAGDEAMRVERQSLRLWWLRRMMVADQPFREKLTFLWHDHFATSLEKVRVAELLYIQRMTLYSLGAGLFDELVDAVARDPAMLVWLDGRESSKDAPNENFARELFELFTLGHASHADGAPAYSERDVAEAARALTGWRIHPTRPVGVLDPGQHDDGLKDVLGQTGALGLDEVVAAATRHPACAPHVVARLWSHLARPARADDPVVIELAAPFADDLDVAALIRRMLLHPEFLAESTRAALVRPPIDLVMGTCRALGVEPDAQSLGTLAALGQLPFLPPDVAGWPANQAWLSTASARIRLAWALNLVPRVDLDALDLGDGGPVGLAHVLGVERWGTATTSVLEAAANRREALALALVAPEHLVA